MSTSSTVRLSTKQQDAKDRRNQMTQRRQELSNKIRKQKKSEYLARKRRLPSSVNSATVPSRDGEITSSFNAYIQSPNAENLERLQQQLQFQITANAENPLVFVSQEDIPKAKGFLECFRKHAVAQNEAIPTILQVLVALTAISFSPTQSYYGYVPSSWCSLLVQDTEWVSMLISLVPTQGNACVVIGNLVGEGSSNVCPTLRKAGMVQALVSVIEQPTAAWALTNAIRNDSAVLASAYCSDDLLSPRLLQSLLAKPLVSTQAAWMVAALTSREEAVVNYLVADGTLCACLLHCLENPVSNDQEVPLVQALGHIASYEYQIGPLLSLPNFLKIIGTILERQNPRELNINISWLAGVLLCDAGLFDHPSTNIVSPALIPILFQKLYSASSSLEEKREVVCAIQNALSLPPDAAADPDVKVVPVPLPLIEVIRFSISSLVNLVASVDPDAVLAALIVIDLLIRRDESLGILLEECNIETVLEKVCDSPLEEAAEVAASLLDDFFYKEEEEEEISPVFAFQPPVDTPSGAGRGRGRGATLPSWMTNNR